MAREHIGSEMLTSISLFPYFWDLASGPSFCRIQLLALEAKKTEVDPQLSYTQQAQHVASKRCRAVDRTAYMWGISLVRS